MANGARGVGLGGGGGGGQWLWDDTRWTHSNDVNKLFFILSFPKSDPQTTQVSK